MDDLRMLRSYQKMMENKFNLILVFAKSRNLPARSIKRAHALFGKAKSVLRKHPEFGGGIKAAKRYLRLAELELT